MDEFTADAFANRDDPIPLLVVDDVDLSDTPSDRERKRDKFRLHGNRFKENLKKAQSRPAEIGASVQDRLLEK